MKSGVSRRPIVKAGETPCVFPHLVLGTGDSSGLERLCGNRVVRNLSIPKTVAISALLRSAPAVPAKTPKPCCRLRPSDFRAASGDRDAGLTGRDPRQHFRNKRSRALPHLWPFAAAMNEGRIGGTAKAVGQIQYVVPATDPVAALPAGNIAFRTPPNQAVTARRRRDTGSAQVAPSGSRACRRPLPASIHTSRCRDRVYRS